MLLLMDNAWGCMFVWIMLLMLSFMMMMLNTVAYFCPENLISMVMLLVIDVSWCWLLHEHWGWLGLLYSWLIKVAIDCLLNSWWWMFTCCCVKLTLHQIFSHDHACVLLNDVLLLVCLLWEYMIHVVDAIPCLLKFCCNFETWMCACYCYAWIMNGPRIFQDPCLALSLAGATHENLAAFFLKSHLNCPEIHAWTYCMLLFGCIMDINNAISVMCCWNCNYHDLNVNYMELCSCLFSC